MREKVARQSGREARESPAYDPSDPYKTVGWTRAVQGNQQRRSTVGQESGRELRRTHEKPERHTQPRIPRLATAVLLALASGCAGEAPDSTESAPGGGPIVRVGDAVAGEMRASARRSLAELVNGAEPGTEIYLGNGEYLVDNPLVLTTPGLLLRGEGLATTLRPRHAGRPVIVVEADAVGLEHLVIDAMSDDGAGRATFAIEYEGCAGCRLANLTIVGTGASSVRGMGMKDFRAEGNRILDAGDDSFFLQGEKIRLIDNVAVRFMDEGIDMSYENTEAILRSNCLSSGRIGIAISVEHPVVNENVIEDVVLHAIYVYSTDARGIITGNVASHTGQHAIVLEKPLLVSRNQVADSRGAGIKVQGMRGGIVQENIVRDSDVGFELLDITDSFVHLNRYEGEATSFLTFGRRRKGNTVRENNLEPPELAKANRTADGEAASLEEEATPIIGEQPGGSSEEEAGTSLLAELSVHEGECLRRLAIKERRLLEKSLAGRIAAPLHVEARSDRDRRISERLLELWKENNPGFLAINIDGPLMTTPITAELLTTLRGAGMKAIGIVRYPAMIFGRMNVSRDAEWHLLVDGSHVATVRPSTEDPGAVISFE